MHTSQPLWIIYQAVIRGGAKIKKRLFENKRCKSTKKKNIKKPRKFKNNEQ